jgi:hypothetical protein
MLLLYSAPPNPLRFIEHHSVAPRGHVTGTACRPDLVAIPSPSSHPIVSLNTSEEGDASYRPGSSPDKVKAAHWVTIESVVEFISKGKSLSANIKQAAAYASYLLMQRPDRVAVLGLYISEVVFSLILVDATGVYITTLPWSDRLARELLLRCLYYIGDPPVSMVDPTVERNEDHTFTIRSNGMTYSRCTIKWSAHPTGRRTMILQHAGTRIPVIKEQYLRCPPTGTGAENLECTILSGVHQPEEMPGVVRVDWSGFVERADKSNIECGSGDRKRRKVRLLLRDEGILFMDIKSPYDALVTAWDVLEGGSPY